MKIILDKLKVNYGVWLVFIAAMLWASDAPFRVGLITELPIEFIVLMEHIISLVVLGFFIPKTVSKLRTIRTVKEWLGLIVISVGGSAGALLLFTSAFNYMNPSVVIVLQKIQPVIAIALAGIFLKEKLSKKFWLYAALIMGAGYLLSFPNLKPSLYLGEEFNPNIIGSLLALGAASLWAISTVVGRHLLKDFDFKILTTTRFLLATVFLLVVNLVTGAYENLPTLDYGSVFSLIVISVTSGAVALLIYYRGLRNTEASKATLAELGFPVAAVIVNYVFLDAVLSFVQISAIAVIIWSVFRLSKLNYSSN